MFQLLASPTLPKLGMFQVFAKIDVPHDIPHIYIYVIPWMFFDFLENNICNLDVPHDIPQ